MTRYVVGIDLSLTSTGLADENGTLLVPSEPTKNATVLDRADRLRAIRSKVIDAAVEADLVVIEQPAFSRVGGSNHDRSGLWWQVVEFLTAHGIAVAEVPPTTLKKYATGKGSATKADMRMSWFRRTGQDVRDDNECDAAWLRAMGMDYLGHPIIALPSVNRSSLDAVRWPEMDGAA